ncbi:MAG: CHASE domain-containing protein [Candidatus Thiodiazotropha lotti]|nr:CHASE domain-containing protein [Candidatus Thiodiazotropha lotti]MCG7999815.1 CHASE domain-containing protein [Candidatus Thiodiazotropha lotti]MCW4182092.1 CHASE domain-containing protein [Candidatus Thiodiazotropha weberae]MCW4191584.1 CHASE domain-containing protein [Candidatus Thiodiazotropha weberae]
MPNNRLFTTTAAIIIENLSKFRGWIADHMLGSFYAGFYKENASTNSFLWGYYPVALVALIGLIISVGLFMQSMSWEKQQAEIAFHETAQDRILLIQREIKFSLGIIQDIASFIEASEIVGRREFRKFVGPALKNQAGIETLAWVPKVDFDSYDEFLNFARRGFPPFNIKELTTSGQSISRKAKGHVYYPILYVQPYQDNKPMLGLNIGTDSQVKSLFEESISKGTIQIANRSIIDSQTQQSVSGIAVVVPVFVKSDEEQSETVQNHLRGYALGIFNIGEIIERALENLRPGSVDIRFYQGDTTTDETLLYTHYSRSRQHDLLSMSDLEESGINYLQKIEVENLSWSVLCTPVFDKFEAKTFTSWIILIGGFAFTALLTIYTANLVGQTNQIRHQVAERTALLRSTVEELNQEVMERKAAETELQNLNETLEHHIASRTEEAERRAEYLEQFAYVTSHDLKAPLRAVSNLAEWIEEDLTDKLDNSSKEQLALLRDRVRRMHDLIEGLLEYSRVGKTSDVEAIIDTRELIQEITDSLSPQKGFTIKIKGEMPILKADRLQLGQVFSNLIGNSLKHHGGSKGKIRISSKQVGDYYEFTVCDNGQGIASEYHDKVFKMFQTLKSSDYNNSTGIGLALVKKIVIEHGGSIQLNSAVNKGACFTFLWPYTPVEDIQVYNKIEGKLTG